MGIMKELKKIKGADEKVILFKNQFTEVNWIKSCKKINKFNLHEL
jgi:hypothetical protein